MDGDYILTPRPSFLWIRCALILVWWYPSFQLNYHKFKHELYTLCWKISVTSLLRYSSFVVDFSCILPLILPPFPLVLLIRHNFSLLLGIIRMIRLSVVPAPFLFICFQLVPSSTRRSCRFEIAWCLLARIYGCFSPLLLTHLLSSAFSLVFALPLSWCCRNVLRVPLSFLSLFGFSRCVHVTVNTCFPSLTQSHSPIHLFWRP